MNDWIRYVFDSDYRKVIKSFGTASSVVVEIGGNIMPREIVEINVEDILDPEKKRIAVEKVDYILSRLASLPLGEKASFTVLDETHREDCNYSGVKKEF